MLMTASQKNKVLGFIGVNFLWVALVGLGMHLTNNPPSTETGLQIISYLYMPAPAIFTLIFERFRWREIADKYGLSFKRWELKKTILWATSFYSIFTLFYLVLTLVLGNWLRVPGVGHQIITNEEFLKVYDLKSLPLGNNIHLLYLISFLNSIFVGMTVNFLFAMGEELAWRGYLWRELKSIGHHKANLCLGVIWGLWHAPIILQGYNFPGQPILGVGYMILSTVPLTFMLTSSVEKFKTIIAATLFHGYLNATAYLAAAIVDHQAPLGTVVGLVSIVSMLGAWTIVNWMLRKY